MRPVANFGSQNPGDERKRLLAHSGLARLGPKPQRPNTQLALEIEELRIART